MATGSMGCQGESRQNDVELMIMSEEKGGKVV
jgi:hypothetical protein